MKKKLLFAIIPKSYWIAFILSLLLRLWGRDYFIFYNIIWSILIMLLSVKLAVLLHETGHLLFAKLAGGTPRRVILGRGHKILQAEIRGVKVIINSDLNAGFAYASFDGLPSIQLRLFVYIAGGFLFNLLISSVFCGLFGFIPFLDGLINAGGLFGLMNFIIGISSLIPYSVNYQGTKLYSDGLLLCKLPFYDQVRLDELSATSELLDAYDLYEAKQYEESIRVYEKFQAKTGNSKTGNLGLSLAYLKLGNFQKGACLLEELIPLTGEKPFKRYAVFIYNALAWMYLILNRLEDADTYSEMAYKLDRKSAHIRGTRGSVLIEKGQPEQGKDLLISNVDFRFVNNQTLSASIYLSLAFFQMGAHAKSMKYHDFVKENLAKLDVDERVLFERILKKIDIKA